MNRNQTRLTRVLRSSITAASILFLAPADPFASVFKSGDDMHISRLHQIEDDLYCSGEKVRIDGVVDGDLTAFGYDCTIEGTVTRSANLLCRYVQHSGRIDGALRAIAEDVTVSGQVGGSVVAMGAKIRIRQGAFVERDVNLYGGDVSLDGTVSGKACIGASVIHMTGTVRGDVELKGDDIIISPPAVITGNLTYVSEEEAKIDTSGVTILGETTWNLPEAEEVGDEGPPDYLAGITLRISSLLAAFLLGIILVRLFRPYVEESFTQLKTRLSVSLATGFLGVLVFAACIVILAISLLAALVGRILITGDLSILGALLLILSILLVPLTSFVSVSGGIILYSGAIVTAFLIGYAIVRLIKPQPVVLSAPSLLIGLVILTIVCTLPYVGPPLYVLVTLAGAGSIVLGIRNCRRRVSAEPPPVSFPRPPAEPAANQ